ncbi:MAG TPA: OB-fold nucleic acid binding domain-containing protein, partial [Kofleriaceae bacterium]|nr:OB-fold nucleic acid binding domain-containing protein [Kofleriaceae bacterium]
QVMKIAQVLGGYSLGGADLLRRAMGKKIKEVMEEEKEKFVTGAINRQVEQKTAEQVFDLMAFFAGYGFNRSHSVAYGWVSYQTAYLKHHYPHEFIAGLMSCDQDNTDAIVKFIAEARAMGLQVARPDIDESAADFTVITLDGEKVIRFGLGAVRGVGQGAVEAILQVRREEGAFSSLFEFCKKVDSQKANRRVLEALIKSGAYDNVMDPANGERLHRARLNAALDTAMERGAQEQRDRRSGQTSLFGLLGGGDADDKGSAFTMADEYPDVPEWTPKQLLAFEKEALGFYISGHPLDRYRSDLSRYASAATMDFSEGRRGPGDASIGGVVTGYRERPTRRGDGKLAFFQLEDTNGQLEVIVFPKTFERVRPILVSDEPILCSGKVVDEGEGSQHAWRLLLEDAVPLAELRQTKTTRVDVLLNADQTTPDQIEALRGLLSGSRGSCRTVLRLQIPRRSETVIPLGDRWTVAPTDELLVGLERLFGTRVARLS